MHTEQKNLEQKNHELQEQYRNKAKTAGSLQKLYNKLKQQQVAGGLELAAEHEAEGALQVAGVRGAPLHSRAGSGHSGNRAGRQQTNFGAWEQQQYGGVRGGLQSASEYTEGAGSKCLIIDSRSTGGAPPVPATPSNHRTRLPDYDQHGHVPNHHAAGAGALRQGTPYRQPLQNVDPNIYGNHDVHGYRGMSAGVKVGRQQQNHQNGPMSRSGMGVGRPGGVGRFSLR